MISGSHNQNMIKETLELFAQNGISQLKDSLEKLFNELMLAEREHFVNAAPYERSNDRIAHCNGFKNKTLVTRSGVLDLQVPQVREGGFYPSCLNKGERTEQALKLALAEAYVQGVSTRKMKKLTEELCGTGISSMQVSRFSEVLDKEIDKFRNRPLGCYTYLYLDAQYEKIRYEGSVRSMAVLKAIGVTPEGYREVLGLSCEVSEAEVHWRTFIEGLLNRGLKGVRLVISDSHSGLRSALRATLPSVPWQRCLFHLAQNAAAQSPSVAMRKEICLAVKEIYQALDCGEAESRLKKVVERFESKASKFCIWLEEHFVEGLTYYNYPKQHWQKIRTVNVVERMNEEQKRRTRQVRVFPSITSCLRLATSIAIDIHEEWAGGRKYLSFE